MRRTEHMPRFSLTTLLYPGSLSVAFVLLWGLPNQEADAVLQKKQKCWSLYEETHLRGKEVEGMPKPDQADDSLQLH